MRKSEMTKAEIGEQISNLLDEINDLENALETLEPGAALMTLKDAIADRYEKLGELRYRYHEDEDNREHAV